MAPAVIGGFRGSGLARVKNVVRNVITFIAIDARADFKNQNEKRLVQS
jgi:hypothetical protein